MYDVVEGGADFLVALGSTGEAAMLDENERQLIIAIVNEHRGDAKLIVGTGTSATASTCTWTKTAQDSGADGALIVMPPYTKPTQAGIIAHFTAIAEAAPDLPLIAYNVPSRTGINLTPATVRELWRIPTVVALKESSNDLMQISQIASELPEGKTLLAGDDAAHEEVGRPQRVEEVARARLLLAVVFLEVEEGEDVCVPRLQVHGEGALPLAAALVDETRRVIVDA